MILALETQQARQTLSLFPLPSLRKNILLQKEIKEKNDRWGAHTLNALSLVGKKEKNWKKAGLGQRHIKLDFKRAITPGRIGAYKSAHHDTQGAQE